MQAPEPHIQLVIWLPGLYMDHPDTQQPLIYDNVDVTPTCLGQYLLLAQSHSSLDTN